MNVTLKGRIREILDSMIADGYASTKSEAIRLAILNFGEGHNIEDILMKEKLDRIDSKIREGRRRVLTTREALGPYAKHAK